MVKEFGILDIITDLRKNIHQCKVKNRYFKNKFPYTRRELHYSLTFPINSGTITYGGKAIYTSYRYNGQEQVAFHRDPL